MNDYIKVVFEFFFKLFDIVIFFVWNGLGINKIILRGKLYFYDIFFIIIY